MLAQPAYIYVPIPEDERLWTVKDVNDGRGFGIYTNNNFKKGDVIGRTHYFVDKFAITITELGKFHNHSQTPNCIAKREVIQTAGSYLMVAKRDIVEGEELTTNYDDYRKTINIEKPNLNWKKSE